MDKFQSNLLTNTEFLNTISSSFRAFLEKGTSRSTDKLKPLHGAIAADIAERLGSDYEVWAQGYGKQQEATIHGRYIDKKVDITIFNNGKPVAGIAVKFVMQNYSQNSNNYFENMLGETANIRCENVPYFQVFIILDRLPYYGAVKEEGRRIPDVLKKWESFTDHNIEKYIKLSTDNIEAFYHTPNKTLIYVVHLPDATKELHTKKEYLDYYRALEAPLTLTNHSYNSFNSGVILNDYETFIDKVYHTIKAL